LVRKAGEPRYPRTKHLFAAGSRSDPFSPGVRHAVRWLLKQERLGGIRPIDQPNQGKAESVDGSRWSVFSWESQAGRRRYTLLLMALPALRLFENWVDVFNKPHSLAIGRERQQDQETRKREEASHRFVLHH
jgi:hypothetical protein